MATIILTILIFGAAGYVVYRWVKRGFAAECEDCDTSCPVKVEIKNQPTAPIDQHS
ncbi:MAG: FeoB-associated Cys-rich membrane protein [Lactobacillaceae bacterium]|jgi:hypothetical protein|nr:FeoB-associated Cys-rich membrane protein [Lactobacillaceae bacterium]